MNIIDELNLQNHKLTEVANVLVYLLNKRTLCDTEITNNLLFEFLERIDEHMKMVNGLYQDLLTDKKTETNRTARMFMSGELELKRIINQYCKKWCRDDRKELWVADHKQFTKESSDLFALVLSRVQDETEKLYPMVRDVRDVCEEVA